MAEKLLNQRLIFSNEMVVERTNSWHNRRFRKLFTRDEKKADNYLVLVV